jgi:hypothetical protein
MPELPCACANLRRAARAVTRIYNHELRSTELELTQYTLLMTLVLMGETTQKAVLIGVHRGLKSAGWPNKDRKIALGSIATLLMVWFFAELVPAWSGFHRRTTSQIPTIQYGIVIPLVAGVILFLRWPLLRRVVDAVPRRGWPGCSSIE